MTSLEIQQFVADEQSKVNSTQIMSEFELEVMRDIVSWMMTHPEVQFTGNAINAYWNERLN